jgi:hypothetical protein
MNYKNLGAFSGTKKTERFLTEIDGKKYALKTGTRNAHNEYEATVIMDLFGINHPTVILDGDTALIEWIDHAKTLNEYFSKYNYLTTIELLNLFKIIVLDGFLGNWDRHGNNIIVSMGKIYAIDNEDIFYKKDKWVRLSKPIKKQLTDFISSNINLVNAFQNHIDNIKLPIGLNEVFTSNFENKKDIFNSTINQIKS